MTIMIVFSRDDLSEATKADAVQMPKRTPSRCQSGRRPDAKADAVQMFDMIVAGESQVQVAYAAAAQIHFDLKSS
jgi:hypothetical protein